MNLPRAWTCRDDGASIVAVALHSGHDVRREVRARLALDDESRRREEDAHTDQLATVGGSRIVVCRSRFELDLNRPREHALYRTPEQAWGLEVWRDDIPEDLAARSLALYDRFYSILDGMLRARIDSGGRFLVLDIHSYNHRRSGPDAPPEPPSDNPDLNIGTGSLDRDRWGTLVDSFAEAFSEAAGGADVRENVRFKGGHMSRWIHSRYGRHGCCLALEFKKTYMDEWTGELYEDELARLHEALAAAVRARDVERAAA